LLRHAREGPASRPLDWKQSKELERIDGELKQRDPDGKRGWYINGQRQTFSVVKEPQPFRMGSPPWEADRIEVNEKPHLRVIGRNFAIATKPLTVAQWQRFVKERPDVPADFVEHFSPEPDGPIVAVSWYAAAQYCNWLSKKEGIAKEQWCYPDKIVEGMKPLADHLKRTGYRLPTEAEWEFACRAGTSTERYYGVGQGLLPRYTFYQVNALDHAWPVGQKRPNDLGLFDMHGNVFTWCQERAVVYPSGRAEDKEDSEAVAAGVPRSLRSCAFNGRAPYVRSANRYFIRPGFRDNVVGVRLCRTLPSHS
jgi:formylglycine-generating enzyme required for sulfatase activity